MKIHEEILLILWRMKEGNSFISNFFFEASEAKVISRPPVLCG